MNRLEEYQRYLALSSELFCTLQADGKISGLAGPWLEKTGKTLSKLSEDDFFLSIHQDDIVLFRNGLMGLSNRAHSFSGQIRVLNPTLGYSWFEVTAMGTELNDIYILRALDISKQKPLQMERDSIRQRLELAIRAVKFGVWDWNLKTGKLIWDSYMYELFEISELDFTSDYEAFEQTLFEADSIRIQKELQICFQRQDAEFNSEFRIRTKLGKTRIVKAVASCFYDKEGKIDRLVGNNWDMTESRETEKKLRDAYYEIEKFFSISLDPLCVATTSGFFKRVNKAFVDILGYSEKEIISQPFLNFVHPEDVAATVKELESLSLGVPTMRFENRYRTKSGSYRHFSWVVVPDSEKENGVLYGVVRDLTDEMRSQHKALQSAQMVSLGEMASGVAHEINNPLTIVQGKARQIEKAVSSGTIDIDKVRQDLQKIVSTTDRIVKIVKGLRSFSRDSSKDAIQLTSVRTIIEEVLDLSSERFKYHEIDLRVDIKSDIDIECRGAQIGQIIMNLLNNGHDAVQGCSEKWVELRVQNADTRIYFIVTDSGVGITPDVAEKMMRPFFTTKEVGKGTGLGLSISKGIADDHGGSLKFDSSSINTRFILELPITQSV